MERKSYFSSFLITGKTSIQHQSETQFRTKVLFGYFFFQEKVTFFFGPFFFQEKGTLFLLLFL